MRLNCTKLLSTAGMWIVLTTLALQPAYGQAPAQAIQREGATTVNAKLIPRTVLFGNPERAAARISPNGQWLSFLAPVDGVLNVWVAPRGDLASAEPVTEDKLRGIRSYYWAYTGEHILYTQDKNGDENWHVYATDVQKKTTTDLTPIDGVNARIDSISEKSPEEILIAINDRNPQLHDIWRANLLTGEKELLQENPGFAGFLADDDYRIRFAIAFTPDGGQQMLAPVGQASPPDPNDAASAGNAESTAGSGEDARPTEWEPYITVTAEDAMTFGPAGFDKTGQKLYLMDSRQRDTAALFTLDLATDKKTLIAEDEKADVGGVLLHPTEKNVQAVSFTYARRKWKVIDESIADDLEHLRTVEPGEFQITSRTLDDSLWTVAYILDDGPIKFYLYSPQTKNTEYLFSSRSDLDEYDLVKMQSVVIKSRDGLDLVSYYSLPPGTDTDADGLPERPQPMVLDVHGGPWARDGWGYNASHQWLANRGYAVLSVNFRGSTGFGKSFTNAANGEWSGKMHDDLLDAVDWAVAQGIADPARVAIMGGSYGGYATLVGLTFTPDRFACGVDIVGPSNLVTLLNNMPPYWMPIASMLKDRVGDWTSEGGREQLLQKSPLTLVDRIEKPLLIGQGANDPRVTQVEADQIVDAMQQRNIPVTYVLYPDEGHGFARPENRLSFYAVAEAFLADHLGGRFEPVGEDFAGASIQVPAGADGVPGLEKALEKVEQ